MPATRRGKTASSRKGAQSTLSFGSKSRVSKPSTGPLAGKTAKDEKPLLPTAKVRTPETQPETSAEEHEIESQDKDVVDEPQQTSPDIAIQNQVELELRQPKTEEDKRAERITHAELKRYWAKEEQKRKAPRVHQDSLSINEKILRLFDLSSNYGPCIGIDRMKRWRRAQDMGLNPPIEVLAVLRQEEAGSDRSISKKAYVDELLS